MGDDEPAGVCAAHPERRAAITCPRCGDHACDECAYEAVPGAMPLCAECGRRREERVEKLAKDDRANLGWWALGLGVIALVPMIWPAQLGAVILGGFSLSKMPADAPHRWAAWVGIALGLLGGLGSCVTLASIV